MARFMQRFRIPSLCRTSLANFPWQQFPRQTNRLASFSPAQSRKNHMSTNILEKSPIDSNILRILRNEIRYQFEYAPPQQPAVEFNAFTVEDRPGEQWIVLRGKFGEYETIKIQATMFDGSAFFPKSGEDSGAEDVCLHISLLVDISKGEGRDLEFVCSAWPHHVEIQKVYVFSGDGSLRLPYMGPNFRDLNIKLQNALTEFLKARGVNDDLSVFLHRFMINKDRIELIKWLTKVNSFVEK